MGLSCVIVDDNELFRQAARVLLEREGLTVAAMAASAAEALERTRALEPDIVLVDVRLGEEDGFELAGKLAEERHAVILISANAEIGYPERVSRSHAIGYLAKSELSAARIHALLTAPHPRQGRG